MTETVVERAWREHPDEMARAHTVLQVEATIHDLTEAIRLTVEYVGLATLPPIEGWSWFDALAKYRPDLAAHFAEQKREN